MIVIFAADCEGISPMKLLSFLHRQADWGMGKKRPLSKYMEMVGLNMKTKRARTNDWCHRAEWPDLAAKYKIESL